MADVRAAPDRSGLRDRKKARTRALIRENALRLFAEQGFQATTVEQIAAAAEVSPTTFFRYFPAKEDVVTSDGLDVLVSESCLEQPPGLGPVAAVRAAVASVLAALPAAELARLCSSAELGMSLHQAGEFARTAGALAAAAAQRDGREHDDFTDRILAGAVIGAIMAAAMPEPEPGKAAADLPARLDAALACLEAGLPRPAN
jgi:AcrR family transcriptional regulator